MYLHKLNISGHPIGDIFPTVKDLQSKLGAPFQNVWRQPHSATTFPAKNKFPRWDYKSDRISNKCEP